MKWLACENLRGCRTASSVRCTCGCGTAISVRSVCKDATLLTLPGALCVDVALLIISGASAWIPYYKFCQVHLLGCRSTSSVSSFCKDAALQNSTRCALRGCPTVSCCQVRLCGCHTVSVVQCSPWFAVEEADPQPGALWFPSAFFSLKNYCSNQCRGYGSKLDPYSATLWIRIRKRIRIQTIKIIE